MYIGVVCMYIVNVSAFETEDRGSNPRQDLHSVFLLCNNFLCNSLCIVIANLWKINDKKYNFVKRAFH
jgi:hypothetical protein